MTLSRREKVVLAVSRLPIREDGWRRATYRDQLHESVPGLSRGGVSRSFDSGELEGLVLVQGVGCSARSPEGYKLTEDGERLAREAGSIRPEPADPAPRSGPDPVLGSGLSLGLSKTKREQEPTKERTDPAPIRPPDPAPPADRSSGMDALAKAVERFAVLHYAAMTGTPLCGCTLPMVKRTQQKSGIAFWGCGKGKGGCGVTETVVQAKEPGEKRRGKASDAGGIGALVGQLAAGLAPSDEFKRRAAELERRGA